MRSLGLRQVHAAAAAEARPGPPRDPAGPYSVPGYAAGPGGPADAGGPHRLCPAVAGKPDRHRQGLARAGLRAGEPGGGHPHHPPPGGGDGGILRHRGLVLPGRFPAVRRPEAAAEPGLRHGHAAGCADSGRAHQPAGPHRRLGLPGGAGEDQPGAGHRRGADGAPAGRSLSPGHCRGGDGPGQAPVHRHPPAGGPSAENPGPRDVPGHARRHAHLGLGGDGGPLPRHRPGGAGLSAPICRGASAGPPAPGGGAPPAGAGDNGQGGVVPV